MAEQAEAAPMQADARVLHDQGVQLCTAGHLQAGIVRLRRALMMTRAGRGDSRE